jgi:class 3 adenylate cyclase
MIEIFEEVWNHAFTILDRGFKVEVTKTQTVPTIEDSAITFDNLDEGYKQVKELRTCVLFIDIRNSTELNQILSQEDLTRLYGFFVKSMVSVAQRFGGHVRNIVGDRVMVIFDEESCFRNAVYTAVLMHTVSDYLISPITKQLLGFDFCCGVGIDYGLMTVSKVGAIRRGQERDAYRSLVWLGRPANIASKLTDLAYKIVTSREKKVSVGYISAANPNLLWRDEGLTDFLRNLQPTYLAPVLSHQQSNFCTFFQHEVSNTRVNPPILMTRAVFDGYASSEPTDASIVNGWWSEFHNHDLSGVGEVLGGWIYFRIIDDVRRQLGIAA